MRTRLTFFMEEAEIFYDGCCNSLNIFSIPIIRIFNPVAIQNENTNFLDAANFIKVIPDALSLNELSSMEKYLRNKFNADSIQMQIDGVY